MFAGPSNRDTNDACVLVLAGSARSNTAAATVRAARKPHASRCRVHLYVLKRGPGPTPGGAEKGGWVGLDLGGGGLA